MDHVAIMKKSWRLIPKILNGKKIIESRWYKTRRDPWNNVRTGDNVYFKNSGEKVKIRARVKKIKEFSGLTPKRVKKLLRRYGERDGIEGDKIKKFYNLFKNKNYSILVFLKNSETIKPFEIDKTGFGQMCAWICIENIENIKKLK